MHHNNNHHCKHHHSTVDSEEDDVGDESRTTKVRCLASKVHVPNFEGCQGRRTGVAVTTVSKSLILGGRVTKVLKNGDEK